MPRRSVFRVIPFQNPSEEVVYRVVGTLHSRRIRENYTTPAEAEAKRLDYQRQAGGSISDHRAVTTWLTPEQVRAAETAQQMIGDRSLVSAAQELLRRAPLVDSSRLIESLAKVFLATKSGVTAESLRKKLDLFFRTAAVKTLGDFTFARSHDWIFQPGIKNRTQISRRATLTNFANWLASKPRHLLPKDLLEGLPEIRGDSSVPRRLNVKQVTALMHAAEKDVAIERASKRAVSMLHNYVLRTFVGLRPSEVEAIAAAPAAIEQVINLSEGYVFVPGPPARAVKLTQSAFAWLTYCRTHSPVIVFKPRIHERVKRAGQLESVWQPDICRHTFGSFSLRRTRNVHETAEEMGNSARIVRGYYAVPLTDAELLAFDRLLPPGWKWKGKIAVSEAGDSGAHLVRLAA